MDPTRPPRRNFAQDSCTIEFDGASRGNPGRAGAGAVLRASDNTVISRVQEGAWRANHPDMAAHCGQAKQLLSQFDSYQIQHVNREFNSAADAQASRAVNLAGPTEQKRSIIFLHVGFEGSRRCSRSPVLAVGWIGYACYFCLPWLCLPLGFLRVSTASLLISASASLLCLEASLID
ncbi:hypothetical protein Bca101_068104 [Brassica carinata]